MLLDIFVLIAGLFLLLVGGEVMVRGSSTLARSLGVSPLVIGLTIVAFGTSAPELAVNARAALEGSGQMSFGNVIGSNIANIALILGACALMRPLEIEGSVITREIPMMLLATAAVVVMASDVGIRGDTDGFFDRSDAIVLLLLFCVFIYYTVSDGIRQRGKDAYVEQANELDEDTAPKSLGLSAVMVFGGLAGLIWGGQLTVESGSSLAESFGVPESIIGLSLIALGTSLPELVTGIIATRKGQTDLAIGNVVGSNIFNLLLIFGVTGCIAPIPVPKDGMTDLVVVCFLSVLLLPLCVTNRRRILRWEGALLLLGYFAYVGFRVVPQFVN